MSAFDRALANHQAGRLDLAAEGYGRILEEEPAHVDALHLLGQTLHQRGENARAIATIRQALLLNPRVANYHNSLGLSLQGLGDNEAALRAFQTALTLDPGDADAHNNLGIVFTDLRRFVDAERALRRSLDIRPGNAGVMNNLGRVLVWRGDCTGAVDLLREACAIDAENAMYWNSLGVAQREVGAFEAALAAFKRALEIDPELIDAHVSRAHALLFDGDFKAGWLEHEWRLRRPRFAHRMADRSWSGEDLAGRDILLWAEQGFGDAIQFIRYAPLVAARGGRVIVECRESLHRLFRGVRGVASVAGPDDAPSCEFHAALMSLPAILGGTAVSDIPNATPYIPPPPAVALDGGAGRRVGLVWAGNPDHSNDRNRSHALASFAPLAGVAGVEFFALQTGVAAAEPAPRDLTVTPLGTGFQDFADTAAAVMAMDLVISVDTSVAHLAGALGRSVWLIVPPIPDWRWRRDGDSSPWYPSMRLFRQAPGEPPTAVFLRLAKALVDTI